MADLGVLTNRVLSALITASQPLSGRKVASMVGASPTATNRALAQLAELGAVTATAKGNAKAWSSTSSAGDLLGDTVEREALILTALPLEYAAVRNVLDTSGERRAPSGVRYCEGRVRGDDITWTVRVFETKMGNATAASALARAAADFPPDLVVFAGVAGGLRGDKQHHGDVVIVENVYNGSAGKSFLDEHGESAFKHRFKPVCAPAGLVHIADSIRRERPPLPKTLSVDVIDLVSTETVEADPSNELAQTLKHALDNVVAIDMESFGVYSAARALGLPAISVRGLSDLDGDKKADADAKWQPLAAGNAAAVALELLIRAHPGDLPPSRAGSPDAIAPIGHGSGIGASTDTGVGESGDVGRSSTEPSRALPPLAMRFINELATRSSQAARAAVRDLSRTKAPPATTVNLLSTHPPAWIREDRTGVAWAALASVADAVGSRAARTAWSQASTVAGANGDAISAVLFAINHVRSSDNESDDAQSGSPESVAATRAELEAIDVTGAPALAPVVAAWVRMSHISNKQLERGRVEQEVLDAAGNAVAALGGVVLLARLSQQHASATASPVPEPARLAVEHALVNIVLSVGVYLLIEQDGRARAWVEAAQEIAPWSSEARLRHLQVTLQGLHDSLRVGGSDSVTAALVDIEERALAIRAERRAWGGKTAEALALAGRARIEMDDAHGALRLLTGAPRGIADAEEAASEQVAQFATVAALRLGEVDLAAQLANSVSSEVERRFLRAATFNQARHTQHLAKDEYRAALALARNSYELERALAGLARLGVNFDSDDAGARLSELAELDAEAADLVRAWAALVAGDGERALTLSRRYRSLAAVELTADALSTLGRSGEAIDALDEYGRRTGDVTLRVQALQLAGRSGLWDRASTLAEAVIGESEPGPVRDGARRARSDIAAREGDWETVERQLRLVVRERARLTGASADPAESEFAWQLAEALYHRRKFVAALEMLRRELSRAATDPGKVRLALALMHQLRAEHVELLDEQVVAWVLNVASSLLAHEDIGASAVALLMQLPGKLAESTVVKIGELFDGYFDRYGQDGSVRQLELDEDPDRPGELDLAPLVEQIRSSLEPQEKVRTEVGERVLQGRLPLGYLSLLGQRSYAELLLTQALNQTVARPATGAGQRWVNPDWVDNARAAIKTGTVVIDTSALVLASQVSDRRALLGHFTRPLIPRSLQDDIYRARQQLALRPSASMGWSSSAQRPVMIDYPEDVLEAWAQAGVELDECLRLLYPVADAFERDRDRDNRGDKLNLDLPLTAQATARQLGHALWADDLALLRLAEADNVPAFGTVELIAALRDDEPDEQPSELALLDALKRARVVDLPPVTNWAMAARAEQYSPGAYMALAMTRPSAWVDVMGSVREYQQLIRAMWDSPELKQAARQRAIDAAEESDSAVEEGAELEPALLDAARVMTVVAWCEAACVGIGRAVTAAPARVSAIAALIGWTAMNTDVMLDAGLIAAGAVLGEPEEGMRVEGPRSLAPLLEVSRRLQHSLFPAGDGVRSVIDVLRDTIASATDAATAAGVVARAISFVPGQLGEEAFAALLKAPHHGGGIAEPSTGRRSGS